MLLPLLLQVALILFFIGLTVLIWTLSIGIGVVATILVAIWLTFMLVTAVLPAISDDCAYKSPQARVFFTLGQWMKAFVRDIAKHFFDNIMSKHETKVSISSNHRLRSLALMRSWTTWNAYEVYRVNKPKATIDAHALAAADDIFRDDGVLEEVVRPCLDDLELEKAIPCLDEIYSNRITGYEGAEDNLPKRPAQGTTRGVKATIVLSELALDILKRINEDARFDDLQQERIMQRIIRCLKQLLSEIPGGLPLDSKVLMTLTSMLSRPMLCGPCFELIAECADYFDGVDLKGKPAETTAFHDLRY